MKNQQKIMIRKNLVRKMTNSLKSDALLITCLVLFIAIALTSYPTNAYAQQPETPANAEKPASRTEVKWVNADIKKMPGLTHHILQSKALGHEVGYVVWLPEAYSKKQKKHFPVIYFLHGSGGTEAADGVGFSEKVAEAIAKKLISPVICVFPNGGMSGYRGEVETMILDELIPTIDKDYRTLAKAESRALGGFSMGGAGSVYLAIMHPDLFCAAGSMGGGIGGRRDDDERTTKIEQSIDAAIPVWKKNNFGFFLVNGDNDRPDAFKEFAEKLEKNGIDCERVIQPDTKHDLGLYYQVSGGKLISLLGKHIKF